MKYLFDPATPSVAIVAQELRFPVNRIYCVGRNYAAHAREMGGPPSENRRFSSASQPMQ